MHNPFLIGETIYLRGLSVEDALGDYPSWLNDKDVCQYSEHHVYPYTQDMARAYIEQLPSQKDKIMLAIVDKKSNTHIGNITLLAISSLHRSAEFSILIGNKNFHGKGISKEASMLLLNHGFNTMNLHRICCGTMVSNTAMQRLARSLGMVEEGVFRDEVYKDGTYHNTQRFSILKDEFNAQKNRLEKHA